MTRLAQAARGDYERAQATRQALLARLNGLKQEAVTTDQALVRLRELEREVEASRAVYQAFLTRSRETSEQERVNTTNVRVLSEANLPNKRSLPPRTIIVLGLALAFGAAAGAGLGFVRDWTDDRIHTRRDLEAVCGLPILAEITCLPDESGHKGWSAGCSRSCAPIATAPPSWRRCSMRRTPISRPASTGCAMCCAPGPEQQRRR